MSNKSRDREQTKERLLEAAERLLARQGFEALGVNAVADEAGVSKVLIYRYFGSFEGLLEELGRKVDPAAIQTVERMVSEKLSEGEPAGRILEEVLLDLLDLLESDPLTRELLVWELAGENELTRSFARVREDAGLSLNALLRKVLPAGPQVDLEAIIALVSSGFYYLFLRSRYVAEYNGIPIQTREGWLRLAKAAGSLLDAALSES